MSFFDDASLVFLPSGEAGKDGKAYSMKPTDGSGDFTFSRGSNLTATRVDSNGLIEKGRENLLLQSNQFDTTWLTSDTSVTSGQSGYDGSSDAWLLTKTGSYGHLQQSLSAFSGVHTFSVYIKAGDSNWARVRVGSAPKNSSYFDLQNGVIGASGTTPIDSNIENIGGGWYRCSITTNISASIVYLYPAEGDGLISGTSGSIYIQDAQLEQGLVATEYIESGASTGLAGILEDSPRFDYSGGASCPSLLLEPSRTNLIDYSEAIEFGISTNECTQTITNQTNPSGNNVSYLASAIDSVNDQMRYDKNGLSSGSYFLSAFVKGDGNTNRIRMRGTGGGVTIGNVYWDVAADGTTTLNTSLSPSGVNAITEDYGDGWYRIGFEETFDGSSTSRFAIYPSNGDVNASTYIWGVQWEQGSYPTSYIPNHSGGSVTREAETNTTANISSVIGQQEGTFFLDFEYLNGQAGENENWIALESENGQERVMIYKSAANNYFRAFLTANNSLVFNNPFSSIVITPNTRYKIAFRYSSRDIAIAINGNIEFTDSSTYTRGSNLSRLLFNETNVQPSCRVHQSIVFDSGLTNSELENLTS